MYDCMKSFKNPQSRENSLGLQPLELAETGVAVGENVSNLEFILTKSAFGFEYALIELKQEGEFGFQAEKIRMDLDSYKRTYFDARLKLKKLDELKLKDIEEQLRVQKMIVFSQPQLLH